MARVDELLKQISNGAINAKDALDIYKSDSDERTNQIDKAQAINPQKQCNAPSPVDSYSDVLSEPNLQNAIRNYISNKITKTLGLSSPVSDTATFLEMGLESIDLIQIANEIGKDIGEDLYPTLFFEYQNLDSLSAYFFQEKKDSFNTKLNKRADIELESETRGNSSSSSELSHSQTPLETASLDRCKPRRHHANEQDIAIIGVAGRFARSSNVSELWEKIRDHVDCISEIPMDHFDFRDWFSQNQDSENKTYSKWGSFIDVNKFDARFFGISPREAEWMDPQLRILLEIIYETADDAGYGGALGGSNTGVYIGVCFRDYWDEVVRAGTPITDYQWESGALSSLSGRISYAFDFHGGSVPLDNACASSLTAIHLAARSIQNGDCEYAFAGGANLLLSPLHYVFLSRLQALSPSGRCHAFEEKADGFVPGEGVGSILLKSLKAAESDNDNIYAIIKGSAINHVGRSNNPTAPRTELQSNLLRRAWENSAIDPETISYIEAHGTGTKLGDPIEIEALKKAFSSYTSKQAFCYLGSTKAHIGHCEAAAGIASVIKVIMAMKHGTIPSMPKFENLNPYLKIDNSPLMINKSPIPWPASSDHPKRAGISSFGLTGNNAHIVLEDYVSYPKSDKNGIEPVLVVLSARTPDKLREYAGRISTFLKAINNEGVLPEQNSHESISLSGQISDDQLRELFCQSFHAKSEHVDVNNLALDDMECDPVHLSTFIEALNSKCGARLSIKDIEPSETLRSVAEKALKTNNQSLPNAAELENTTPPPLKDIAYTLQIGREHMEHRLACIVSNEADLSSLLDDYALGSNNLEHCYIADSRTFNPTASMIINSHSGAEIISLLLERHDLHLLAFLWSHGVNIDWRRLYDDSLPRKVPLPSYPFDHKRHWVLPSRRPPIQNTISNEENDPNLDTPMTYSAHAPGDADKDLYELLERVKRGDLNIDDADALMDDPIIS
jgi:acyl transferase domain-containing protein/acyl carrier protein